MADAQARAGDPAAPGHTAGGAEVQAGNVVEHAGEQTSWRLNAGVPPQPPILSLTRK